MKFGPNLASRYERLRVTKFLFGGPLMRVGTAAGTHGSYPKGGAVARIIVTTEQSKRPDGPVLLDESVCAAHLNDDHPAAQLVERLSWAVIDAEQQSVGWRRGADAV